MTNKKLLPDGPRKRFQAAFDFLHKFQLGTGFWGLIIILGVLSFLVTYEWGPDPRTYVLGEIVEQDITAPRSLTVQDDIATKARREAVESAQPLIANLNLAPVEGIQKRMQEMIIAINQATDADALEQIREAVTNEISEDISANRFRLLTQPDVQNILNNNALPWLEARLREGVIGDARELQGNNGIIIRNLTDGSEVFRTSAPALRDIQLELSLYIRTLPTSAPVKSMLNMLLGGQLMATLTINLEATAHNAAEAAKFVPPVTYEIKANEVIVRQGEKIEPDHLVKLSALWRYNTDRFHLDSFAGVWLVSLILVTGFFFSPGGKKMSVIRQKELLFIGFLIALMTLLAKAFYFIGFIIADMSPYITPGVQAYALPLAGAAGLAALTLNTRRYYVTSMLMALFCTIVVKGSVEVFLFYFGSAILNTWLITDTQSRKDVVWAVFPQLIGMLALWAGCTLAEGGDINRFISGPLAVALGAVLSMVLIFALSPVVELAFGFTTRFVLMELMNQEHPALRQLMIAAPGTYHHSIIVANLVEVAAKAIGAHSLLAKVGAIYHDIGKMEKPEYFIENQFRGINLHDKLTPTMSALVLISHVKRGTELAQQYKLGQEITDIIRQHHGSSAIRFFYHKALAAFGEGNVRIEDFCYAGPRPQTREAALIMLADVVEASSRTLADPTPSRIKAHVRNIIRNVLAEGQLDGADLTFRDLNLVEESFTLILTGIFHKRIEYPDKDKDKNKDTASGGANPAQGASAPASSNTANGNGANNQAGSTEKSSVTPAAPAPVGASTKAIMARKEENPRDSALVLAGTSTTKTSEEAELERALRNTPVPRPTHGAAVNDDYNAAKWVKTNLPTYPNLVEKIGRTASGQANKNCTDAATKKSAPALDGRKVAKRKFPRQKHPSIKEAFEDGES